jgi:hypothetical protein
VLLLALPFRFNQWWWTPDELLKFLQDGGVKDLPKDAVIDALKYQAKGRFEEDRYEAKRYYLVGEIPHSTFRSSPKSQVKMLSSADPERKPAMNSEYFLSPSVMRRNWKVLNTLSDELKLSHLSSALESSGALRERQVNLPPPPVSAAAVSPMISHNGCGVILSGYKFIDIGFDREWTDIVASHSISCSQPTLRLIGNTKKGYELIDHYQCSWCKRKFEKRASRDVVMLPQLESRRRRL